MKCSLHFTLCFFHTNYSLFKIKIFFTCWKIFFIFILDIGHQHILSFYVECWKINTCSMFNIILNTNGFSFFRLRLLELRSKNIKSIVLQTILLFKSILKMFIFYKFHIILLQFEFIFNHYLFFFYSSYFVSCIIFHYSN